MEAVRSRVTSPSRCLLLLLCLMIVTCLLMYSISLSSLNTTRLLPALTAFRSFINSTATMSPIGELLTNISNQAKVIGIDCAAIFLGSKNAIASAKIKRKDAGTPLSDLFYINASEDCVNFTKQRGYITSPLTEQEEQFPLAYSMLVYKDSEMVERLLRAIYRPQNVYCIHVDQKASHEFFRAISSVANCFTNVFIATRRSSVVWATYTVLEPELFCMEELWRYRRWKYFINLTGQEFPLKTNYELVRILDAYRGAVDVSSTVKYANKSRWKNTSPPHGLRPVKGSVHIVVNRDYVDYILHNETAKDLLRWTKTTHLPDETFFAMLNSNPKLGIRGTYKGEPEHSSGRPFLARFKNWGNIPCAGRSVRSICILTTEATNNMLHDLWPGIFRCISSGAYCRVIYPMKGIVLNLKQFKHIVTGDLPLLVRAAHMFANKFYLQEDRVAIGCLEEKLFNDTRDEYTGSKAFNTTYYENLDIVKNKVE